MSSLFKTIYCSLCIPVLLSGMLYAQTSETYKQNNLSKKKINETTNATLLIYDSNKPKLMPTFPTDSEGNVLNNDEENLPDEKLSQKKQDELTKDLKVAAEKRDTDYTKIFELLGQNIEHYDNYMIVHGGAVLKNKEAYILADQITYDPTIKQARLQGNVRIYRGNTLSLYTQQATIYLNSDFSIIRPFYIQDTYTGIWTRAESASQQKTIYRFANSMVSSCSYTSPAWRLNASKGHYNQKDNSLTLWHPKVYIGDIPVFYIPYLNIALDNKRTSGFLYPTLGTSSTDGLVYMQPYFLAFQNFWDITLTPQARTSRGAGINFEFRAVDSSNDRYIFHLKYFYNFNHYVQELNLLNQHVYGFDFKHNKRNVIQKYFNAKTQLDNGMFFDIAFMNDIDYMRLSDVRYYLNTTSYVSKVNFYMQTHNHYVGLNMRYFLNLYSPNNNTTFHNLPTLQYHKYTGPLFIKELLYSFDYQSKYAYRTSGYSYFSNEFSLPIGLQFSFLNKYFSLGAWLNVVGGNILATNTQNTQIYTAPTTTVPMQDTVGNYVNLNYKVSLHSDIGRKYNKFFHSMQTAISFNAPIEQTFFANGILSTNILSNYGKLDLNALDKIQNGADIWNPQLISNIYQFLRKLDINVSNYIYNNKGQELFYWKVSQVFNFDDKVSPLRIPMENKIGTSPIEGLNLSVSFFYSWFYNNLTEFAANAYYAKGSYAASLSYYLKRDDAAWSIDPVTLAYRPIDSSNYLSASFRGDLGYFGLVADISYDFKTQNVISFGVGFYKDIKCFGIGVKAGSNRTPVLSQSNTIGVIDNIYVKAEFKFVPLTTFSYTYRLRPTIENTQTNANIR